MKLKKEMLITVVVSAVMSLVLGFILWLWAGYSFSSYALLGIFAA